VYLSLGELLLVIVLGLVCLYFFASIRVRELAVQAVARASRNGDFQLLDQAVHIHRASMSRDGSGRWRVWRQYRFDYTHDGVERRQGFVVMLGRSLQTIIVTEPESEPERTLH